MSRPTKRKGSSAEPMEDLGEKRRCTTHPILPLSSSSPPREKHPFEQILQVRGLNQNVLDFLSYKEVFRINVVLYPTILESRNIHCTTEEEANALHRCAFQFPTSLSYRDFHISYNLFLRQTNVRHLCLNRCTFAEGIMLDPNPKLTSLSCVNTAFPNDFSQLEADFPNLQTLVLNEPSQERVIQHNQLLHVQVLQSQNVYLDCPKLQTLCSDVYPFTQAPFVYLQRLSILNVQTISQFPSDDYPSLEHIFLDYKRLPLVTNLLFSLQSFPELISLHIEGNLSRIEISNSDTLQRLQLSHGISHLTLRNLSQLQELYISVSYQRMDLLRNNNVPQLPVRYLSIFHVPLLSMVHIDAPFLYKYNNQLLPQYEYNRTYTTFPFAFIHPWQHRWMRTRQQQLKVQIQKDMETIQYAFDMFQLCCKSSSLFSRCTLTLQKALECVSMLPNERAEASQENALEAQVTTIKASLAKLIHCLEECRNTLRSYSPEINHHRQLWDDFGAIYNIIRNWKQQVCVEEQACIVDRQYSMIIPSLEKYQEWNQVFSQIHQQIQTCHQQLHVHIQTIQSFQRLPLPST